MIIGRLKYGSTPYDVIHPKFAWHIRNPKKNAETLNPPHSPPPSAIKDTSTSNKATQRKVRW